VFFFFTMGMDSVPDNASSICVLKQTPMVVSDRHVLCVGIKHLLLYATKIFFLFFIEHPKLFIFDIIIL
jgi:hypothetical protein